MVTCSPTAEPTRRRRTSTELSSRAGRTTTRVRSVNFSSAFRVASRPGVLVFLSDHPTTPDRVAHLDDYIEKNELSGQRGSPAQLATIKQTLQGAIGGGPKDVPAAP